MYTFENMKIGMPYIVTKASDDGTFEVGDHISLDKTGCVICMEAQGWLDPDVVAEAASGMTLAIDTEAFKRRKRNLQKELEEMEKEIYKEQEEEMSRERRTNGI